MNSDRSRQANRDNAVREQLIARETIADSLSLQITLLGILFIGVGFVLQTGALAAMFPIWGVGAILIGGTAYMMIWWDRQ